METFEEYMLMEMPLIDMQKIGKWNDPKNRHGYDKASVGILNSDRGIEKIRNVFNKTEADFNLYFVKKPGASQHAEIGEVSPNKLKAYLGVEVGKDIPFPSDDSITVFFTNNKAADRTPLTPWTIAHRIGHAFQASQRNKSNGQGDVNLQEIYRTINEIYEIMYNIDLEYGYSPFNRALNYKLDLTRNFLESIGTFRSARLKKLNRPFEFIYECFAQYLLTGRVKLNKFPDTLGTSNKQAWGKSTGRVYRKNDDPIAENEYSQKLEHDLIQLFDYWIGTHYNTISIM